MPQKALERELLALTDHFTDEGVRGESGSQAKAVTSLVDAALAQHGRAIVVDVHSYSQHLQPHDLQVDHVRPKLCIGFDPFHASPSLVAAVERSFARLQSTHNVPLKHYRSDPRVQGVMLEIRRDVYMDEVTGVADAGALALLQGELEDLVGELAAGSAARP